MPNGLIFSSLDSTKFILVNEALDFSSAKGRCKSMNGDIVDFGDTISKTNAQLLMLQGNVDRIWLNTKQTLNPWLWVKGMGIRFNVKYPRII